MTTRTTAPERIPLSAHATYGPGPEPAVERMTGWPLVLAWAVMIVGSWAVAIGVAVLLVRGALAVASWVATW